MWTKQDKAAVPRRCDALEWPDDETTRCRSDALPDHLGGWCRHCGGHFCHEHIVPGWHSCKEGS